nr:BREX system serine/threonine kinase PglW [Propionibacterium sp.]
MVDDRWVEVTPSQFPHEAEGLKLVRDLLPARAPFRAWSNFEFRDDRGTWSEVDLLLLTPSGLHLLELKYYAGRLRGTDQWWLRDGHRAEDSPLLLANRKAKRLRSKLMAAFDDWARRQPPDPLRPKASEAIPFIQAGVFLHHPDFVCELPYAARRDLYGLPNDRARSGLNPITDLFTAPARPGTTIYERGVVGMMRLIGLRAHQRETGAYVLDARPLEDGPGWQDWLATHKHLRDQRRRIRFRVAPEGSPEEARRRLRLLAAHEMHVMQRLTHDAILRPEDYVDSELGPGLVYPYDPSWQRLDLWLAAHPRELDFEAQLGLVRDIAEGLQYAHGKNVVHRGLNPRAVLVRTDRHGRLHARLTDWQGVGRTDEATATSATRGVTALAGSDPVNQLAPEERWLRDTFLAPEGAAVGAPGRLRLDVFGLGVLAFFIVTGGRAPATTRADLIARLRDQGGLDVSVELPEAPAALREAILQATAPKVTERLPDVGSFLEALDRAEPAASEEETDPLDAGPGAVLDGRFTLVSRLGAGSTAVGLLVTDAEAPDARDRVLKVALDDSAARRLDDEADALRHLTHPRIVKLLDGPLTVGGRRALLLESAGRETLATHLGNRERLSLDLLERWGTDLLEAVVALDAAGVTHRDLKPANLGVHKDASHRSKHLKLFDFSLTKAPASDTQAGTRPYLDPFWTPKRAHYDSAAERYAAAVVLFEMATGHPPVYGDGLSDPASITDEVTIEPGDLDPTARARLTAFFTRALARDHQARHHTAEQMLHEWRSCFPDSSAVPADADALAEAATADTPLTASGLTARAISALEPLRVTTVGDLALVDPVLLGHLAGSTVVTRQEIRARAKLWRSKFGRRGRRWSVDDRPALLDDPADCAETLLAAARGRDRDRAVGLASLLLGVVGSLDANATQAQLAAGLRPAVTRGRVSQLLATLQDRWAADEASKTLLDTLADAADQRLTELGGVATFDELADHLLMLMVSAPEAADPQQTRLAQGLLRCAVERKAALERAESVSGDEDGGWFLRRRDGRPVLVATRADLLDVAEALGRRADALVDEANLTGTDALVPAGRVITQLGAVLDAAASGAPTRSVPPYDGLREGTRLARLAARLATRAGASATGELHHRDLSPAAALRLALPAVVPGQLAEAADLRDRVRHRFPDLPALPTRPDLDDLAQRALGLLWDEGQRRYRAPQVPGGDTTGLVSRPATRLPTAVPTIGPGAVGQRLEDSVRSRSFVALGVGAQWLDRFPALLASRYAAIELDLTHVLMDALHATAAQVGVPWSEVLNADADAPGSRSNSGLRALVQRSLPAVRQALDRALTAPDTDTRPLLLTDPSLLARYDALGLLADWMDLATARPRAVWLVVPQVHGNVGPVVDGRPLPLTAPSQFVTVPPEWIQTHAAPTDPPADAPAAATRTTEGSPA